MSRAPVNLKGKKFGKLRAVRRIPGRTVHRHVMWECKCLACGKTREVSASYFLTGKATSCGCLSRRKPKAPAARPLDFEMPVPDLDKYIAAAREYWAQQTA